MLRRLGVMSCVAGRVQGSVRYRLAHAFSLPSDIGTQVQGRAKGGGRSGKGKGRKGATATQDPNTALQGHSTGEGERERRAG